MNRQREVDVMKAAADQSGNELKEAEESIERYMESIASLESELESARAQLASQSAQLSALGNEAYSDPGASQSDSPRESSDVGNVPAELILAEKKKLLPLLRI